MKYFNCYSANMAGYLRKNGFKIIGSRVNLKKRQFDVFLFEDSEELRAYVNQYCQSKR